MLHGAGIFTYMTGPCFAVNVGKYSSTMGCIWGMKYEL